MEDTQSLVEALITWTGRLMPDRDRAAELERNLRSASADGTLDSHQPVSRSVVDAVETVCHRTARHLTFDLHDQPGPPDQESPGWPPVPRAEVEERAGFVRSVQRPAGASFGELRLDGFDDAEHAGRYLHAAFGLLDGVDGLILDLRHNGGGAVSTLAMLAEFVLGPEPEHLATVHYRDQPARQWWTTGGLVHVHLPESAPVAMLIGPGTYSSGEAIAYHLKSRGRVRVFGTRTPGAADHVTPIRLTPRVTALIPEGTTIDQRTGTNWEGQGVQPDVEALADADSLARSWLAG
ncbi:MAG TPA: S41 family peptidase [Propionibacteriaceae bacterium]|nr:S41 family peptidase [Propionibacteriaceae bacterium]